MRYEIHKTIDPIASEEREYVTVFLDENNAKTFPADPANPDFAAFLEANPDALTPKK